MINLKCFAIAIGFIIMQAMAGGVVKGTIHGSPKKIVNALIYIEEVNQTFAPPAKHAELDQKNLLFQPHVLPVLKGTVVDFLNGDNVRHNVFSPSLEKYNLGTWPTGEIKSRTFDKTGVYVQLCNVHAEMEGYVVVLQNPFFCLTKKDGLFEIKDVPPGTYVLKAWQEKLKKIQEQKIAVTDKKETNVNFTF